MTLMLVAMFAAAGVGVFAKQFGRREASLCLCIAVALTLIYFLRPAQMT
jgi:ascorbate-specific PTS system EIIC-type component UlaA